MSRGIRQGCPVSAMLFVLALEIMSIRIRKCDKVKGFVFSDLEHKLSQYADDTTMLLSTLESIAHSLDIIDLFCNVSGLKISLRKTQGIWLGTFKNNGEMYHGVTFTNACVRCLG